MGRGKNNKFDLDIYFVKEVAETEFREAAFFSF